MLRKAKRKVVFSDSSCDHYDLGMSRQLIYISLNRLFLMGKRLRLVVFNNLCCFAVQHCSVETQTSRWWVVGATEFIQSTTTFQMLNRTARHSMGLLSCHLLLWLTGMRSWRTLTGKWIKPTRDFTGHATFREKVLKHRLCR